MTVSRVARQILAVSLCAVLLYPSFAQAADVAAEAPQAGGIALPVISLAGPSVAPLSAAAPAGLLDLGGVSAPQGASASAAALPAAVEAHPVISVINQLQAQGALPQSLATAADAARLEAGARTLPAGPMRDKLIGIARAAAAAAQGGSGSGLDQEYDKQAGSEGNASAASSGGWLSRLIPSGLRGAPKAEPKAVDPATLEVPLAMLRWSPELPALPESTRSIVLKDKPIVGQDNALKAIYFGLKMKGQGYQGLFVAGDEGSGRETAVRDQAAKVAAEMPVPNDKIAVTDLRDPSEPLILDVAPGKGAALKLAAMKFLKTYGTMLPRALNSPQIVAARRKIKAEYDQGVKARHDAFAAEVAQVRFDGNFGIWLEARETEEGLQPMLHLTYTNAEGQRQTIASEAQLDALKVKEPSITRSYEELVEGAKQAAEPFIEKLHEMAMENMQEGMAANQEVEKLNGMAAANLVQQLAPSVAGVIGGHNADTPEHKAWEERAKKRMLDFQEELAKTRIGEYGLKLFPQGMAITKPEGDKMVPLTPDEMQAKLASGELSQEALQAKFQEIMGKLQELNELNEKEHQALHANDPAPSEGDKRAFAYIQSILQYAASEYEAFLPSDSSDPMTAIQRARLSPADVFEIDVLADGTDADGKPLKGAPVVFEKNPTYERLFGGLGQSVRQLMLPGQGMVGIRSIRPELKSGSYFRANGGFLVLNVMDALREPGVWPALMRAVRDGEVEIADSMVPMMRKADSVHVKAKVKLVLIGSPMIKMLLAEHDDTFKEEFNASAQFEAKLSVEKEHAKQTIDGYLQFFKKAVVESKGSLLDITRDGMAALLQFAAREVDSNTHVTARFGRVFNLIKEADFWAREAGSKEIRGEHVEAALQARVDREETYQQHMLDNYNKGILHVDVVGEMVGQINGLVVMGSFGLPKRVVVTNTASKDGLEVTWSDQDAEWIGNSAKKSFADVKAFLRNEFAKDLPMNVHIDISFPQIYGGLDGDSATSTMMYAALSSLSGVPISQRFAVTGSADPFGNVQVIGGANEKTEGFFKVSSRMVNEAHAKGINAVIVPWGNAGDLQLKPEVVQAVREGKFKIYRVKTVQQGIELLTGVPYSVIKKRAEKRLQELNRGAAGRLAY